MEIWSVIGKLRENVFTPRVLVEALACKGAAQQELFKLARQKRKTTFPSDRVEVRSVVEISNICRQHCKFCRINKIRKKEQYVLTYDLLMRIVRHLYGRGRRVVLLQSGENRSCDFIDFVAQCVQGMKSENKGLTVILSLGSLLSEQYELLKKAGADRYILKFETSNKKLYSQIKPKDDWDDRIKCIHRLNDIGFKVGSGNIIGLPGQSISDIIQDLYFLKELPLFMASTSLFIPAEGTEYYREPMGDIDTTLNYMALMRIMGPELLIPATSSLKKGKSDGQYWGIMAGANSLTVHDGTPRMIRKQFPIYSRNRVTPCWSQIRKIAGSAGLKIQER